MGCTMHGLSIGTYIVIILLTVVVAVGKRNPNLTVIFSFLHKLVEILVDYFRQLEEESIRDNFVLIYELLDEIIDHGYPQTTETIILKEFIKTSSNKLQKDADLTKTTSINISQTLTNNISWRQPGISYKVNKAFLDVVEKVNSLVIN